MGRSRGPRWTVGDILAVPLPEGWIGAIWLIVVDVRWRRFVILDGFWRAPLDARAVARARPMSAVPPPLRPDPENKHWKGWFSGPVPTDFERVTQRALPPWALRLVIPEGTMVFQSGEGCRAALWQRWRLINDREALMAEWTAAQAAYDKAEAQRVAERKATNSLPRMLRERPFATWRDEWPAAALRGVRAAFRTATQALIDEVTSGTPRAKAAVLRALVQELNRLDDRYAFIETGAATELVERIEELARLVRLRNTNERLTKARDW